ncbi:MAG: phosphoribosyltransferase [Bacteroides sp.]|nr:phosphoribosyltransferase [Bacteroides sp.]
MRHVKWEEVHVFIEALAEHLHKNVPKVSGVYGLPRGGLCPAVMLSHMINVPILMSPCAGSVIIDDIADSGKTMLHYRERGYFIATVFYKKPSLVEPDFWMFEKKCEWIRLPWEIHKES